MVDINVATILAAVINFLILLVVVKKFFWSKILAVIEEREESIKSNYSLAEEKKAKADLLVKEREELLAKSKDQGREIVEMQKKNAEAVSKDILDSAQNEAKLIIDRAQKEAKREKEKLIEELRTDTIDIALSMSARALEAAIDEEEHRRLIDDYLSKVGS